MGIYTGTDGSDELFGAAEVDSLYGRGGNDYLLGGIGGDLLDGGDGFDIVMYNYVGLNADLADIFANTGEAAGDVYVSIEGFSGTRFADGLAGDGNNNWLYGQAGDDVLAGRGGNDYLDGGDGNDLLLGGAGMDLLFGGAGVDTVSYLDATSGVTANMNEPSRNSGDAAGDSYSSIEILTGSTFNDVLTAAGDNNSLSGGDGADILFAHGATNQLYGGAGNDILVSDDGDTATLDGGAGVDFASFANMAHGVTASTTLTSSGRYMDSIEGLVGSQFNDSLRAGTSDNSFLYGEGGNDKLGGSNGNDVLDGGAGNDTLTGGGGADMFVFGAGYGKDTIADFNRLSHDLVRLSPDLGVHSFADIQGLMSQPTSSVVITFDADTTLTLSGISMASLTAADFGFF